MKAKYSLTVAAAAMCGLLLAGAAVAQSTPKVRVATEGAHEPFNYKGADGQLQGFDVEIANALCAKAKFDCEIVAQEWDGIIPGLLAKKYDAIIASMAITEERKKRVAFTDKYYQSPARFVVKKGSKIAFTEAGLKGKNLGTQRGTIHANYLEQTYGKIANIKFFDTQQNADLDLLAGRLDAVEADSVALLEGFLKKPEGRNFEFAGPELYLSDGAGIAVRKENEALRAAFNKALNEIRADGTYKKINDKYFPFDIYGPAPKSS